MKIFAKNFFSLGFFSILTILIFTTSCAKEDVNEFENFDNVENVESTTDDFANKMANSKELQQLSKFPCNPAIQAQIITALDDFLAVLRAFKCGYGSSAAVQQAFEDYKDALEAAIPGLNIPNYVNANPNGGGCAFVPASGTLGVIYTLDWLGCRIGTYLNNPTSGTYNDVVNGFSYYLLILESVFTCDWNIPAYQSLLNAPC